MRCEWRSCSRPFPLLEQTVSGSFREGQCSGTHTNGPCDMRLMICGPVRIETLFYEVWWSTDPWKNRWKEAKNPSQPFVLSTGSLQYTPRSPFAILCRPNHSGSPVGKSGQVCKSKGQHYFTKSGGAPTPGRIGGRRPRTRRSPLCCRPVIQRDIPMRTGKPSGQGPFSPFSVVGANGERFFPGRTVQWTDPWKNRWKEAKNPSQPFVLSTGDPTGYSLHGVRCERGSLPDRVRSHPFPLLEQTVSGSFREGQCSGTPYVRRDS
jgi:hypothetical protein